MNESSGTTPLRLSTDDPLTDFVWAAWLVYEELKRMGENPSESMCWGWLRRSAADIGSVTYDTSGGWLTIEKAMIDEHPDRPHPL